MKTHRANTREARRIREGTRTIQQLLRKPHETASRLPLNDYEKRNADNAKSETAVQTRVAYDKSSRGAKRPSFFHAM